MSSNKDDAFCALARRFLRGVDLTTLKWRHHGLGMLQGEIEYEWRVHIWHPQLKTIPDDGYRAFHDHRFDIDSAVLIGSVEDHPIEVKFDRDGPIDAWAIRHAKVQDQTPADALFLGKVKVFKWPTTIHSEGTSYRIKRRTWHTSTVEDFAVTFVRRSNFDDADARILGKGHSAIVGIHSPFFRADLNDSLVLRAQSELRGAP